MMAASLPLIMAVLWWVLQDIEGLEALSAPQLCDAFWYLTACTCPIFLPPKCQHEWISCQIHDENFHHAKHHCISSLELSPTKADRQAGLDNGAQMWTRQGAIRKVHGMVYPISIGQTHRLAFIHMQRSARCTCSWLQYQNF